VGPFLSALEVSWCGLTLPALMAKSIPDGWHSVTPRLVVRDPAKLVAFLKHAFDASGDLATDSPTLMRIGDSIVMVSGVGPRDPMPAFLHLYVDDIDATYQRALDAGAVPLEEPSDMPYGDRRAMVKDPCGNDWQIATHKGIKPK
jgi:PhnB protein